MCFLTLLKTYLYERQIDEVERVAERQRSIIHWFFQGRRAKERKMPCKMEEAVSQYSPQESKTHRASA